MRGAANVWLNEKERRASENGTTFIAFLNTACYTFSFDDMSGIQLLFLIMIHIFFKRIGVYAEKCCKRRSGAVNTTNFNYSLMYTHGLHVSNYISHLQALL
jgi:hypothetical protein